MQQIRKEQVLKTNEIEGLQVTHQKAVQLHKSLKEKLSKSPDASQLAEEYADRVKKERMLKST
jgi:hypothetical protein